MSPSYRDMWGDLGRIIFARTQNLLNCTRLVDSANGTLDFVQAFNCWPRKCWVIRKSQKSLIYVSFLSASVNFGFWMMYFSAYCRIVAVSFELAFFSLENLNKWAKIEIIFMILLKALMVLMLIMRKFSWNFLTTLVLFTLFHFVLLSFYYEPVFTSWSKQSRKQDFLFENASKGCHGDLTCT